MKTRYYELQPTGTIIKSTGDYWEGDANAKRLTVKEGTRRLKEEARKSLLESLKPGDTVQCVLRHVSRSGMYRVIDFYKADDGDMLYLSGLMKDLGIGEQPRGTRDGVGVGGCGMDMGFSCVYELGHMLWPEGTEKPHGTRNGEPDRDGGYALKHHWL
jgi:hypothetical protein